MEHTSPRRHCQHNILLGVKLYIQRYNRIQGWIRQQRTDNVERPVRTWKEKRPQQKYVKFWMQRSPSSSITSYGTIGNGKIWIIDVFRRSPALVSGERRASWVSIVSAERKYFLCRNWGSVNLISWHHTRISRTKHSFYFLTFCNFVDANLHFVSSRYRLFSFASIKLSSADANFYICFT